MQTHEARFALILPDCAVSGGSARQPLIARLPGLLSAQEAAELGPLTISIGSASVAVPAKEFRRRRSGRKRARCLDAARISGGNKVKSIDVY